MASAAWSTQQLAEYLAAVSAAMSEPAAALAAVERAAEALDSDVAAIVGGGVIVAAVGYPRGTAPVAELEAVKPGAEESLLEVPGIGICTAASAALDYPPGATLVVARPAPESLSGEERGLLRAMARVASLTMRVQRVIDEERSARAELERLAREQAALRTVATLVAEDAAPDAVFAAVAEKVAGVVPAADVAFVGRYDAATAIEFMGAWARTGYPTFLGDRVSIGGNNVATLVFESNAPARVDHLVDDTAPATAYALNWALSSAGAPINVEGRLWGVMVIGSVRANGLPRGIEHELAAFTDLVSTAIGNAQAREELKSLVDEQAALRRVATLVALEKPAEAVFLAVAEEVCRLFAAEAGGVIRYDPAGEATPVGSYTAIEHGIDPPTPARPLPLGGHNVSTLVYETGRPARVDSYPRDDASAINTIARGSGAQSAVGVPISVGGRLWGSLQVAASRERILPSRTEERVAAFAELVATALANAQAREELRRVAEEQAALRRVATLVAEAAPPRLVFAAVAEEVGSLLHSERTFLARFDAEDSATIVGAWGGDGGGVPLGSLGRLDDAGLSKVVRDTRRPARADRSDDAWSTLPAVRRLGLRSAVAAPINVDGQLWGLLEVATTAEVPVPPGTEERLGRFTDLVATAIANSQAREDLRTIGDEQAALRRVATHVARGAPADTIFDAVTEEVHRLLQADETGLSRYDPDGLWTVLAVRGATTEAIPVGFRLDPGESMPGVTELLSGRSVRVDASPEGTAVDDLIRIEHLQAWVASPIVLMGRTWGQIAVFSRHGPLPVGTEERLAAFTELVATAMANAKTQAELTASRARIVATADETRRRIERDLHDGAQQRLVTLALELRAAEASVPPELGELAAELDHIAAGITLTLDELREYARGIHPAILAEAGLGAALKTLARRSAVPVELELRAVERLPEPVEVGAYFVVSESLANVAKHADASVAYVRVMAVDNALHISVRDDGVGGAVFEHGSGLVGLKDRIEALGGQITVESPRGAGTAVEVMLPLAPYPSSSGNVAS